MNYLLTGPEEYLKYQFLEKLKKSLLNGKTSQFNFEAFQASVSGIAEILDSFNTLPLISEKRITVIRDAEKFSESEKDSILKYLRSPIASTTLVLLSSLNGFNSFLKELSGLAKVIRCDRLRPGELNLWIRREFAALKKTISPHLAEYIREKAGPDLFNLKNEIEKIASFARNGAITERHVETVLGKASYETAFELVDLVLEKKVDGIFLALDSLLTRERPHRILSLLAWQFRNFIRAKEMEGLPVDAVSRELGINRYIAEKTKERSKRFTLSDLKEKLEVILEGDFFIKRGAMLPEHALERVLVKLCGP